MWLSETNRTFCISDNKSAFLLFILDLQVQIDYGCITILNAWPLSPKYTVNSSQIVLLSLWRITVLIFKVPYPNSLPLAHFRVGSFKWITCLAQSRCMIKLAISPSLPPFCSFSPEYTHICLSSLILLWKFYALVFFFFKIVMGIDPGASCTCLVSLTTKLHPQPFLTVLVQPLYQAFVLNIYLNQI